MPRISKTLLAACVFLLCLPLPFAAQAETVSGEKPKSGQWVLSAYAEDLAMAQGLPVMALDQPDWPNYWTDSGTSAKAVRSLHAELMATHPNGWQLSAVVRAQSWLKASADAVTVAALDATRSDPVAPQGFKLSASSQSWQGQGIKVGTPWQSLGGAGLWQWHANAQLLSLKKLRTDEVAGDIVYSGAGNYDFNVAAQRANTSITGPFLPPSGLNGQGASLSLALKGEPLPGLYLQLQADDLFSRLHWQDMANDASVLNSQVTTRAADGSLDYAAVINGRMSLLAMNEPMAPHWRINARWLLQAKQAGVVTARAENVAGISQFWLGWENGNLEQARPHWVLEIEPRLKALSAGLTWGNWHVLLATDGQGARTEYRRWLVGWQAAM